MTSVTLLGATGIRDKNVQTKMISKTSSNTTRISSWTWEVSTALWGAVRGTAWGKEQNQVTCLCLLSAQVAYRVYWDNSKLEQDPEEGINLHPLHVPFLFCIAQSSRKSQDGLPTLPFWVAVFSIGPFPFALNFTFFFTNSWGIQHSQKKPC